MATFKVSKVSETSTMFELGERLWLDEDGKVVADGDPSAAFLLGGKGALIPQGRADELGLSKGAKAKAEVAEPDGSLESMTRDELDELAVSKGVDDPASLPNKAAVIEAIETKG